MDAKEIITPWILEDFEDGDRVYSVVNGIVEKGTVVDSESSEEGYINIKLDFSSYLAVPLKNFTGSAKATTSYQGQKDDYYGRIPRIDRIETGTILSVLQEDGSRDYAIVMIHEPGERLLINRADEWKVHDYRVSKGDIFENQLLDWEIEG